MSVFSMMIPTFYNFFSKKGCTYQNIIYFCSAKQSLDDT